MHTAATSVITTLCTTPSKYRVRLVLSPFGAQLTKEGAGYTIKNQVSNQGKKLTYPTPTALTTAPGIFRKISKCHFFLKEPSFESVVILIIKSAYLFHKDLLSLLSADPQFHSLWHSLVTWQDLDFSSLQEVDKSYASQKSIPKDRTHIFLACVLYYNFDMATDIRYRGENYTAVY